MSVHNFCFVCFCFFLFFLFFLFFSGVPDTFCGYDTEIRGDRVFSHWLSDQVRLSVFQADLIRPCSLPYGAVDVCRHLSIDIHRYLIWSCLQKPDRWWSYFLSVQWIGWKQTGGLFPSDFPIEESATVCSAQWSGQDLSSACSVVMSRAISRVSRICSREAPMWKGPNTARLCSIHWAPTSGWELAMMLVTVIQLENMNGVLRKQLFTDNWIGVTLWQCTCTLHK